MPSKTENANSSGFRIVFWLLSEGLKFQPLTSASVMSKPRRKPSGHRIPIAANSLIFAGYSIPGRC
jgi:hypothetical protein